MVHLAPHYFDLEEGPYLSGTWWWWCSWRWCTRRWRRSPTGRWGARSRATSTSSRRCPISRGSSWSLCGCSGLWRVVTSQKRAEQSRAVSRLVTTLSCVAPVLPVHPPPARSGPSPVPPPLRCPHHTRHPPAWSLLQLVGCWVIMMSYLLIIRLHFNIPRFSSMKLWKIHARTCVSKF